MADFVSILIIQSLDKIASFGNNSSAIDSGGAEGARAPPEFWGSEKGQSLISAYRSLAISMNTPGFKKLSTALNSLVASLTVLIKCLLIFCYRLNILMGP